MRAVNLTSRREKITGCLVKERVIEVRGISEPTAEFSSSQFSKIVGVVGAHLGSGRFHRPNSPL